MRESYGALVEFLEYVENLLRRLIIYTKVEKPTFAMTEVVIKITAQLISAIALATKQMDQRRFSECFREASPLKWPN